MNLREFLDDLNTFRENEIAAAREILASAIDFAWCPTENLEIQIPINNFFENQFQVNIGKWFLMDFLANDKIKHVCNEELCILADKKKPPSDGDINELFECPGIYIFAKLKTNSILKVGESNNMRRRILKEHFRRSTNGKTYSEVTDFAESYGMSIEEFVEAEDLHLLQFRLKDFSKTEREFIEGGVSTLLNPDMV